MFKLKKIIVFLLIFLLVFLQTAELLLAATSSSVTLTDKEKLAEKENELDNNITGLLMMPTAYKQDKTIGQTLDFSLYNIIGEITGARANSKEREYTNPVLMSLVSLTGKWALLSEKKNNFPVSAAVGGIYTFALDLGGKMNSELKYKDFNRPSNSSALFFSFSKQVINDTSHISLGYLFGNYGQVFSNVATYYYPKSANCIFSGIDLNLRKFRMYFEIIKPIDSLQNPIVINFRIKKFVPTLVFSYIDTKEGNSLLAIINLRIPLYPPYSEYDAQKSKEKKEEKERFKKWQQEIKELKIQ